MTTVEQTKESEQLKIIYHLIDHSEQLARPTLLNFYLLQTFGDVWPICDMHQTLSLNLGIQ